MEWTDALYYVRSYTGPISNATHGADSSSLFGTIIAGTPGNLRRKGRELFSNF
ncbi:MAG: hypothetical protein ABSA14_03395 [Acidimicrobiales bacterium]